RPADILDPCARGRPRHIRRRPPHQLPCKGPRRSPCLSRNGAAPRRAGCGRARRPPALHRRLLRLFRSRPRRVQDRGGGARSASEIASTPDCRRGASMRKTRSAAILLVLAVCGCAGGPAPAPAPQTIVLSGDLTGSDHQSYLELPFIVPPGVTAITIELDYDRSNRTVVDMGLRDPDGQRGWSGGNKSNFTVSETEATPSYMRGAI